MKKKTIFMYLIKNFRYFRKYRVRMISYILLNLIISIFGAIIPILTAKLISNITLDIIEQAIYFGIIIFAIDIFMEIISLAVDKLFFIFYGQIVLDIRNDICKNVLELEMEEFDSHGSGVFTRRISQDANNLGYIFMALNGSITSILTNIGVFIMIFVINFYIGIYYTISLVIIYLIHRSRIKRRIVHNKAYNDIEDKNASIINEIIRGSRDIKLLNINKIFLNITSLELNKSYQKKYQLDLNNRYHWFIDGITKKLIRFIFLIIGIYLVSIKNLTPASFLVLFMYQDRLFNLINSFSEIASSIKDFDVSAERVFEIVDGTKLKKEEFGCKELKEVKGNITFKNVYFKYNGKDDILKNMSFSIKQNETVAFVGRSGVGKTTIFNLIADLYKIRQGSILIDDIDIDEFTRDTIRNNIAIIPQNPYIFNMTISENLKLVNPLLEKNEMINICKVACLHEDIMKFPNNYDTMLGENGVTLSGGQRQRLAIARTLIKKSKIILFDEATSSLDNETQEKISQAINNINEKYTILIIAHRLSTIKDCNRIMVVDDGQIVADGKHEQLLTSNKLYKNLYRSDFK